MSMGGPYFGIDFGTTNSSMAWYDPEANKAEVLLNEEGEAKTPSLVYFSEKEILVGKPVEEMLEDSEEYEEDERLDTTQRVVGSIKANLLFPPVIPISNGRVVHPVEVAAEVIRKLKRDAERGHFQEEIKRAVVTCPAVFTMPQRGAIRQAAHLAGFEEVKLVEEPVAAALAFARLGQKVGRSILVYDLGGGTFDLAVVTRDGTFEVGMDPDGDSKCGGNAFDQAIYDHCDRFSRREYGLSVSEAEGVVNPYFLKECRKQKERLTRMEQTTVQDYINGRKVKVPLDRETLESLIGARVDETVRKTTAMVERAKAHIREVDTVVLIGGSSQVPLVARRLESALSVEPRAFANREYAVALGAAYAAHRLWKPKTTPSDEEHECQIPWDARGMVTTNEVSDENPREPRQVAVQRLMQFDAEWGAQGEKLRELMQEAHRITRQGKKTIRDDLQPEGHVATMLREKIDKVETLAEAESLYRGMAEVVATVVTDQYRTVTRRARNNYEELLSGQLDLALRQPETTLSDSMELDDSLPAEENLGLILGTALIEDVFLMGTSRLSAAARFGLWSTRLLGYKKELHEFSEKMLRQVRQRLLTINTEYGQDPLVNQCFAALESSVLDRVRVAVSQKSAELRAEVERFERSTPRGNLPPGSGSATIGIEFGVVNSSMTWYNSDTGQAEILCNAEGEYKTPSIVYYGEDEILVGTNAEEMILEYENHLDPWERDEVNCRIVRSIKRNLVDPPIIPIPGGAPVRPVEVVSQILGKLKRDAEDGFFHEEVKRAVIACPAPFSVPERKVLIDAAAMAGLRRVELLDEPVVVALAAVRTGLRVGRAALIYDLGAGTFDLSVVVRKEDGSFYVPIETAGSSRLGGDDFDIALYHYCDEIARRELGRPISLASDVDLAFLRQCRTRKENLSLRNAARFASYLVPEADSPVRFQFEIDRETFEGLIREQAEESVQMTVSMVERAKDKGYEVDTLILTGGSSRVPLIQRLLAENLPMEPYNFAEKDHAVTLGAAYHAHDLWGPKHA